MTNVIRPGLRRCLGAVRSVGPATVAVTLALVIGAAGFADAATGGSFILGKSNSENAIATLANTKGTPLSLQAPAGKAPFAVNRNIQVNNLNGQYVDGKTAAQLQSNGTIRCVAVIHPQLSILPLASAAARGDDGGMISNGAAPDTRTRIQSWIALGVVYVVWGSTYLAIRVGVGHLPPLLLAGIRYVVAGALLYPIARRASAGGGKSAGGGARPGARAWLAGAVIGVLLLFGGNGGVSVAETTLPSGVAAVLVATVPLWMIVFAWPVERQRVTLRSAAGLAIGLGGVAILVGAGLNGGRSSGVFIVLGASAAWGFGSVLSHRLPVPANAMLAAAIEMLAGGVVLLAVAAATGEFSRAHWSAVPATSWIALAYLIGPGSILAFTAYGYALSHLPVATVSTYAYVNPVVAVLAGIVFLGEQFSWREGLGAALVLASVVITLQRPRGGSAVAEEAGQQPGELSTPRSAAGARASPPG